MWINLVETSSQAYITFFFFFPATDLPNTSKLSTDGVTAAIFTVEWPVVCEESFKKQDNDSCDSSMVPDTGRSRHGG